MSIFKFKWPYKGKLSKDSEVKVAGQPIARVIDVEETEEGIYVTAEFYDPESKEAKLITGFDPAGLSLGPIPANDGTLPGYAKADAEMTMALYGVHPEYTEGSWIKPGTKWGCLTVILASLGLWVVVYFILHWLITGQAFPIFDW